jgi:hypothetical protein
MCRRVTPARIVEKQAEPAEPIAYMVEHGGACEGSHRLLTTLITALRSSIGRSLIRLHVNKGASLVG